MWILNIVHGFYLLIPGCEHSFYSRVCLNTFWSLLHVCLNTVSLPVHVCLNTDSLLVYVCLKSVSLPVQFCQNKYSSPPPGPSLFEQFLTLSTLVCTQSSVSPYLAEHSFSHSPVLADHILLSCTSLSEYSFFVYPGLFEHNFSLCPDLCEYSFSPFMWKINMNTELYLLVLGFQHSFSSCPCLSVHRFFPCSGLSEHVLYSYRRCCVQFISLFRFIWTWLSPCPWLS